MNDDTPTATLNTNDTTENDITSHQVTVTCMETFSDTTDTLHTMLTELTDEIDAVSEVNNTLNELCISVINGILCNKCLLFVNYIQLLSAGNM